jgi:hypothetical protein
MFGDVASPASKWNKPLTARLLLFHDKRAGGSTSFGGPTCSTRCYSLWPRPDSRPLGRVVWWWSNDCNVGGRKVQSFVAFRAFVSIVRIW